jgi:hypothetical protein
MADVAGSTPEQYALKVRTHPGVLQISATNKMRGATTVQISWAGRLVESYEFKKQIEFINHNLSNTKQFISSLPLGYQVKDNGILWENISAELVINFFEGTQSVENLKKAEPRKLNQFIQAQLKNKELSNWRVALMSKKNSSKNTHFDIAGKSIEIGNWTRTEDENNSNEQIYYLKKSHLISPKDEFIDLSEPEYNQALETTNLHRKKEGSASYPSGQIVRNKIRDPKNPLLLIYLLDPEESLTSYPMAKGTNPFVGYAISFPKSNFNSPISYAVNEELMDRFDIVEEDPEDYGDD